MTKNVGPDGLPFVFHDLPASSFPFTITAYTGDDVESPYMPGTILWSSRVDGPGALRIPGAPPGLEGKIRIVIKTPDETYILCRDEDEP